METLVDWAEKAVLGMGGWLAAFFLYIKLRVFTDEITNNGITAYFVSRKKLHTAADDDCVGRVMELLDGGADIDSRDKRGNTPLMCAVLGESYACTWLLLSRGGDPNLSNKEGNTPLHAACENGDMAMVCLLVEYGSNPAAKNEDGDTPREVLRTTDAWLVDRAKVKLIEDCCFEAHAD